MEEFPCLVHKLSVILTAVKNGVKNIQAAAYNGAHTVLQTKTKNLPYTTSYMETTQ